MKRNSAWKTGEAVFKDMTVEIDPKGRPMLQGCSKALLSDRITHSSKSVVL